LPSNLLSIAPPSQCSIHNRYPINVVGTVNKWNGSLLNRNWLREFHWLPEIDNSIFELHRIGVPADFLRKAGYEYIELLHGGYSELELLSAGYTK